MVKEAPGSSNKKGKMYDRTINIDHSVNRNINNYTNIKVNSNSNINNYNSIIFDSFSSLKPYLSSVLPCSLSNGSNVLILNLSSNNSKTRFEEMKTKAEQVEVDYSNICKEMKDLRYSFTRQFE